MISGKGEENPLIRKCSTCKDALDMLRLRCLERGAKGISGLARAFRIMDGDNNRQLSFTEFKKGISDYGLQIDDVITRELFDTIDKDNNGSVDFDEFLQAVRYVSGTRLEIINKVFEQADINGDGVIDYKDISEVFDAKEHPCVISGEWDVPQVYTAFLDQFDTNNDGKVSKDEFTNYYEELSASIDDDGYFEVMMKNAWKLT